MCSKGWLLLRILNCFPEIIAENEAFPAVNSSLVNKNSAKKVFVEKETYTPGNVYIKKIKIEAEAGAIYNFEMYAYDNQLIIYFSGGV